MLLLAIGRILQFALLLLTLRIATTLLSPIEMGKIAIVTATAAIFSSLLLNPVGMFMNRRLHAWKLSGRLTCFFRYFWLYVLAVGLFSIFVLEALTLSGLWLPDMEVHWLILLVFITLIFGTFNQVMIPGLNLLGFPRWFNFLSLSTTAANLVLAVMLVSIFTPAAHYWLIGLVTGQLLIGLIAANLFFGPLQPDVPGQSPRPELTKAHLIGLFGYAYPVAIAVGLGWLQNQGYRYLMEDRLGLMALGLFVSGYGISSGLVAGFDAILSSYFHPRFYQRIATGDANEQSLAWRDYAQATLPSLLLLSMFIVVSATDLSQILLGPKYRTAGEFIAWGAVAETARVATATFGMLAHARMKTKALLLPNFAGAAISVGLIWWLIPIHGAVGVGIGLVLSASASLTVAILISCHQMTVILSWKPFAKSAVFAGALWILSEWFESMQISLPADLQFLPHLLGVGILFMLFQYLILRPILRQR